MSTNVSTPHFAYPFAFTAANGAKVVQQGSFDEIVSSIRTVLACPVAGCMDLPTFGIPDLTFQGAPPSMTALLAALRLWEPRANESAVVSALDTTQASWGVQITPQVAGTGQ